MKSPRDYILNEERVWAKLSRSASPYVTVKAGVSLDGKIAARTGASKWITGAPARDFVHLLRERHDGIMVGANTVAADDPLLTARFTEESVNPARIVLDSNCRTPPTAKCLSPADGARRIVVTGSRAPAERVEALEAAGVEVLRGPTSRPQPSWFLPTLREAGLYSLLVEGGGEVHGNLIANRESDELFLFIAACIIGGADAPGWCSSLEIDRPGQAPRLDLSPPMQIGEDIVLHGYFNFNREAGGGAGPKDS